MKKCKCTADTKCQHPKQMPSNKSCTKAVDNLGKRV